MTNHKTRILIIANKEPLLTSLKFKLHQENFRVETITNKTVACKKIRQLKPDLIVIDLALPNVHGNEILKKIKQDIDLKEIPIVAILNSSQSAEVKDLLQLNVDDYVIKTEFTIDDILERVCNILEKKKGQPDVLIAEDEAFLRILLAKKLRLAGLNVITTLDGRTSLKNILELKPKVLVLDLLMPGIDGIEILQTLNKNINFNPSQTKILILSNYSGKEEEPIIKKMTQGYYIKSNFDIDEVVEKIKGLF